MEIIVFIIILVVAVAVLTQPLWRKKTTSGVCESTPECQNADCTDCPLTTGSHTQAYLKQKYPKR